MKKPSALLITIGLTLSLALIGYLSFREGAKPAANPALSAPDVETEKKANTSRGIASFYGVDTNGTRTASGVPLNDAASTAAHRNLPFGSLVRVTNLTNGLKETVVITDRGPYIDERIIDLSHNAARNLDMLEAGIVSVEIEVLYAGPELARQGP